MRKSKDDSVKRRDFLKAAAAGTAAAAALAANPVASHAAPSAVPHGNATAPTLAKPPLADAASHVDVVTVDRPGSDFMVDALKTLNFEYLCANPGNSFPQFARVADQLRRKQKSRIHHLLPRGIRRRHGAWLRQDRRQAAARLRARHGGIAARVHGNLRRVLRSRARLRHSWQFRRCGDAFRAGRLDTQRARPCRHGPRFREMGRPAHLAAALLPSPRCARTKSR